MAEKRIALVSGAGGGIGLAIVRRLVDDGHFVIAVDKDVEQGRKLKKEFYSRRLRFYAADIGSESNVKTLFATLATNYQQLDVLVNNAGIIADNMIWKMKAVDFDKVIRVNLRGTWLMCREAALIMRRQRSGRIINIASRAWLGNPGQSNYSASKAGIVSLTRVLALELGASGVAVNCVAPGLIDSPMTRSLEEAVLQSLIQKQPTRTMGKPEDVANAVAFLSSEQTNFITGQTIYVDGGRSIGAG